MNKLSALCAALLLAACGNPHDRYVGHWQPAAKGADPYRVLEIGKSADGNYRLRRDVLGAHPADETLLALADGSLSNTGGSRLTLSDDGRTLQLADAPYRRLLDSEIEARRRSPPPPSRKTTASAAKACWPNTPTASWRWASPT